jgi:DNA ligase (NAD+)
MNLKDLQTLIDKADIAYYTTGNAIMEDTKYDKLMQELKKLNPSDVRLLSVGSSIKDSILQKRKHKIPMGSLNKALNEVEFDSWIKNNLTKNGINSSELLHISLKMDGGSIGLEYTDGRLSLAVSRGDGIEGEDITANALKFKNLPKVVKHNNKLFTGYIRGEVVLKNDDWLITDPDQTSNPRNQAAGVVRRKDGTMSEYISFYAFRAFDSDEMPLGETEEEMSKFMEDMGFDVAPYHCGNRDSVWAWYSAMQPKRSSMDYWIDGTVVKLNNIEKQMGLGEASVGPKGQVAIKFDAEGAETELLSVDINVGCTGAIVPVANFTPCRIGGTTISCATLCNWENIDTLGVYIGDTISVIKAGDIIPRVMEVVKQGKNRTPISEPKKCPCCSGKVGRKSNIGGEDSTTIYCLDDNCPAVVKGRIDRYLSSLDILGIGESVIEGIIDTLNVKTPADLYLLNNKESALADMLLSGKTRFGEKRAAKLIEEIEKKRKLTLSEFLGSLGIFGLGKRRVALIQEALEGKMDKLENWLDDTLVVNAETAGVPNLAQRINSELIKQSDYILSFLNNGVEITKSEPKVVLKAGAFTFCITGKLSQPKKFYQDKIEKAGHGYTDTLSSDTTYLVAADPNSGSSKLKKATKNGTKVISEKELLELV